LDDLRRRQQSGGVGTLGFYLYLTDPSGKVSGFSSHTVGGEHRVEHQATKLLRDTLTLSNFELIVKTEEVAEPSSAHTVLA
jgi:hypothetical protein